MRAIISSGVNPPARSAFLVKEEDCLTAIRLHLDAGPAVTRRAHGGVAQVKYG